MINSKAAFGNAEFGRSAALELDAQIAEHEAKSRKEARVLACMREVFPPALSRQLFVDLLHITVVDVHVLALALEHVSRALHHLEPTLAPEAAQAAAEFTTAWTVVRDLRNGLEHEEEYLAGLGQHPHRVDPAWTPPAVGVSRHTKTDAKGLVAVSVLGCWYNVKDSIAAAVELRRHLAREQNSSPLGRAVRDNAIEAR